jgi:hypothetical protein
VGEIVMNGLLLLAILAFVGVAGATVARLLRGPQ